MLTPQDIADKNFDKALLNGYDAGDVDNFLEAVSNDYNALYKENAILKGKLKVLVEKVEEYRSTEDAMRMALLTAQRMGEEITVEAKRTKEEMIHNTEVEIKAKLTDTAQRVSEEETRLALAAKETAKFIELSQAIMRKHSEFLSKLETARRAVKPKGEPRQAPPPSGMPGPAKAQRTARAPAAAPPPADIQPQQAPPPAAVQPAPRQAQRPPEEPGQATKPIPTVGADDFEIDDIALQIGSVVEQLADDEAPEQDDINMPLAEEPPPSLFDEDDDSIKLYSPDDETEEETSPRPKFDFDDLKFGANFDSDD
ncbi:MAG: DivIVA domain-containing protein [Oscillospiraceae bacterium]|nr:DivIVA domain-containing protein [Oscillospiraceae bacterium]